MGMSLLFNRLIATLVLLILAVPTAAGQFTVVSSTPAHGDTNVSLSATVTLTFNAPLDTTAAFEDTDGFYLGIETIPETGEPSAITLSPDRQTFSADLVFEADTKYIVFLTGARSESGDPLAEPFAATFTTGGALPTGSVSGMVTEALTKQGAGAAVAVFPDDPVNGLFGSDDGNPAGITVVGSDGSYTIDYVEDGPYHAISIRDGDKDGLLDFAPADPFGLYDSDGDGLIDAFDVEAGGAVDGIDIVLVAVQPVSARQNAATAQTLAESFYSDAALVSVAADLTPDGRSAFWVYLFYSSSSDAHLALVNLGNQFAPSSFIDDGGGAFDIVTPLPDGWLDSDDVATIANENGGGDFLAQWEDVDIFGSANNFTGFFEMTGSSGKRPEVSGRRFRSETGFGSWRPDRLSFGGHAKTAAALRTPTPVWFVNYYGYNVGGPFGFLDFIIHAVTGEIDPPLAFYTSGRANLDAVNALAAAWSSDAALVRVESGFSGVHPSGLSSEWNYTYYSATLTKSEQAAARVFVMQENEVVNEMDVDVGSLFSTEALPESWVDTPSITATADANSDDFRDMNPQSFVQAFLSRGIFSWDLSRPVWQYDYFGSSESKTVYVNGESGNVIVGTEGSELPIALSLDQNYPNPFNPTTTIAYDLPSAGGVTIRIFDALGRQVRLLVDRNHTAGSYTVVWDGRDDAGASVSSGIYIYKIEAGQESATRSMILLR
ncbi:MAG: T9SS type A sorting domain-containing protein [Rhodothermia bacterium]|nr:T9SS type A sorting domain-containing protein [Rhodothermia bacterium]